MKWTTPKTSALGGLLAIVSILAWIAVRHWFPPVKDSYFKPDFDNLRQVPAGIASVRPTRSLPSMDDPIRNMSEGGVVLRMVGRDVTLRQLMAEAYNCEPGMVVLPADAPKGGFDFLITVPSGVTEQLQSAIRNHLGYTAHHESREVAVLKLELADTTLPGIRVSPEGEGEHLEYKDGRFYFHHKSLHLLLDDLANGFAQPVLDETGLIGRYNYSIVWNASLQEKMQSGTFQMEDVKASLKALGLRIEPGTATLDLVIVEKTR